MYGIYINALQKMAYIMSLLGIFLFQAFMLLPVIQ